VRREAKPQGRPKPMLGAGAATMEDQRELKL
jgi:hypothetical protein